MLALIKDKDGKECFKISGRYIETLFVEDLQTGDNWKIFTAPMKPTNSDKMFGMNLFSL